MSPISYAGALRRELALRNRSFARSRSLDHAESCGELAVIVYKAAGEQQHGNFLDASYTAILRNPTWSQRLNKVYTNAKKCLPREHIGWKELDSCMSSDALLMNVFCYPRSLNKQTRSLLGISPRARPQFGVMARVPLLNNRADRTELDLLIGDLVVEAKLTETNFQTQRASIVESYQDFAAVFDRQQLPRTADGRYLSYQLIRNVLAAKALEARFCLIVDERRPDLVEAWYQIAQAVTDTDLRTRCQSLTWQELCSGLDSTIRRFLDHKYGIVASGQRASHTWEE